MTKQFNLSNADCHLHCKVSPSTCVRGTVVVITEPLKDGSVWRTVGAPPVVTPPGTYRVVNRKHFRSGWQVIEAV